MSVALTVNGEVFDYPEEGENPSWGETTTAWAVAVTDILATLLGNNDVVLTSYNLSNNSAALAVPGLLFSAVSVRSAKITADVYITTSTAELHEYFELVIGYENVAGTWDLSQTSYFDDSGITFTIVAGQVKVATSNVAGASYAGKLTFKATAIAQ